MAKKSAKSKGYRKAVEKKPYLSKRDIIILCVILAVVAVGAILLFTYDDGALKVKDGRIVDPGENWLIVNGNLKGGRRYYKLGEVGEIDGYDMEAQPFVSDENLNQFNYTPGAEDSAIKEISVSASAYDPARLAESNARMMAAVKDTVVSDVATGTVGDLEYSYYSYTREYYVADEDEAAEEAEETEETAEADAADEAEGEAESADAEPNHFDQAMNAYVAAPRDGSIVIAISAEADSAEGYLSEDQLRDIVAQVVSAVTLEEGK